MSNNNEQNGRQPPLPPYTSPPSDPRIRTASLSDQQSKICRDFVWGICTKGAQCKYQHELEFKSMKAILKFCHDYQNRPGCTRPNCTYLHTSKEEEDLFLATGQIPRVLAERHAAMSSANMAPEGIPPVMYEFMVQPPPPPPPAPLMMGSGAPPPPLPASLLAPPPPPPPPTATPTPVRTTTPLYTAPPPHNPPAGQFKIDTSKPPPPLGANISSSNGATKRPADTFEAGPSKARKPDSSKVVDNLCGKCVQRELRIELYRQEMQKLECEKVCQSYIFEQKSDAYDIGKLLLKSVVSPELFRILDEFIEGSTQVVQLQDLLAQSSQTPSFVSSSSSLPKQFLLQFADSNNFSNLRNLVDIASSSSVGMDESTLLQSISALTRRANPITNHTSDLQTVLEMLRNAASSERSQLQTVESRTNELLTADPIRPSTANLSANRGNGLSHFFNGQKVDVPVSAPVVNPVRFASTSSVAARTYPNVGVASTSQPGHAAATTPTQAPGSTPAAAPPYMAYNPAHPLPAARPYYPQPFGPGSAPMPTYNNSPIRTGLTPQTPTRPTTSVPPPNPQNYNPYVMGRYPSQYYPPFQ